MKFTVVTLPSVDDALTRLWLESDDGQDLADASNWIERQLKNNPLAKVTRLDDVYFLRRDPLVALCKISVDDRLETIIEVHRVD